MSSYSSTSSSKKLRHRGCAASSPAAGIVSGPSSVALSSMAATRSSLSCAIHSTLWGAGAGWAQPTPPQARRAGTVEDGARGHGVRRAGGHPLDAARERLDHRAVAGAAVGGEVVGDVQL